MKATRYYPIFAELSGRRCLVIGGGDVAQRKAIALLGCGARVTVVSPTLTRRLSTSARQGRIQHLARRVRPTDLRGAWLVCAATDDQAVNKLVSQAARRLKIFTNIVDQTPLCSFIAPAIVRRGPLTIAVSTGGASPSLAKALRRDVERAVGTHHVAMLRLLRDLRGLAKDRLTDPRDRKRYFDRLLRGRVFALVREGKPAAARRHALALLERASAPSNHQGRSGPQTRPVPDRGRWTVDGGRAR